ncbi:MAG: DUF6538 domain-containing protein [Pseudomonadales bacterium]
MLTKKIPYTFNHRGYYYFSRRIPCDLQNHYRCKRVVHGMKTQLPSVAKSRALVAAAKLDEYWSHQQSCCAREFLSVRHLKIY